MHPTPSRAKGLPSKVHRAEIARLCRSLIPSRIAAMFGITAHTVRNIKREAGIPPNPVGGCRLYGPNLRARGQNHRIGWPLRPRGQARLEWAA